MSYCSGFYYDGNVWLARRVMIQLRATVKRFFLCNELRMETRLALSRNITRLHISSVVTGLSYGAFTYLKTQAMKSGPVP